MISFFEQIDQKLFFWINQHNSPFFDAFFFLVSDKYFWIPFYVFLLWLVIKKYKAKSWIYLLGLLVLITATDQMSVHLFKDVFQRYRPCHNLDIKNYVHLYKGKCGGLYGFISSHAANASALALYFWLTLSPTLLRKQWIAFSLILYVLLIMYSRVYLGQHYPFDVVMGSVFGLLCAWLCFLLFRKLAKT